MQALALGALLAAAAGGAIIAKRGTPVTTELTTCTTPPLATAQLGCEQRTGAEADACRTFAQGLHEATDEWNAQRAIHCAAPAPTTAWKASEFCLS